MGAWQRGRRAVGAAWALGVLLALSACTLARGAPPAPDVTRDALAARLDAARQAQVAALDLWDRVIVGQAVSCEEAIPAPPPMTLSDRARAGYPGAELIAQQLNEAMRALRASADLWNIECADPRPAVPLSRAREGRAQALAAGAPLDEAAALLAGWPPP